MVCGDSDDEHRDWSDWLQVMGRQRVTATTSSQGEGRDSPFVGFRESRVPLTPDLGRWASRLWDSLSVPFPGSQCSVVCSTALGTDARWSDHLPVLFRRCAGPFLYSFGNWALIGASYVLGPVLGTGHAVGTGHSFYPWGAQKLEMGETWPARNYLPL